MAISLLLRGRKAGVDIFSGACLCGSLSICMREKTIAFSSSRCFFFAPQVALGLLEPLVAQGRMQTWLENGAGVSALRTETLVEGDGCLLG